MAIDTKFALSMLSNYKIEDPIKEAPKAPEPKIENIPIKKEEPPKTIEEIMDQLNPTPLPETKIPKQVLLKEKPKKQQKEEEKKKAEESKEIAKKKVMAEKEKAQKEIDMKTIISEASYEDSSLNNQSPRYPIIARKEGEEGEVVLLVKVSAAGMPIDIVIYKSSGFERLDNASMYAVKNWKFVPAKNKLQMPVESVIKIPFIFNLQNEKVDNK